jgi:hypothetical protein
MNAGKPNDSQNKKDVILPRMTYSEVATVMAALRVLEKIQNAGDNGLEKFSALDLREMEHFEETQPLTAAEIDRLVRRINVGPSNVDQRTAALKRARVALRHINHNETRAALVAMVTAYRNQHP